MEKENSLPNFKAVAVQLTKREIQTIKSLCAGKSKKEIASQMSISLNTVKSHTKNIFVKLGVHSNVELLLKIKNTGLLNENHPLG